MTESDLYGEILTAHSHGDTRLFRQNSALAYVGEVASRTPTTITLLYPRIMRVGTVGIADLGGFTRVIVTEELLGTSLAVACQIECKHGQRRATAEQAAFIAMVKRLGGRAGVARTVKDAEKIIRGL